MHSLQPGLRTTAPLVQRSVALWAHASLFFFCHAAMLHAAKFGNLAVGPQGPAKLEVAKSNWKFQFFAHILHINVLLTYAECTSHMFFFWWLSPGSHCLLGLSSHHGFCTSNFYQKVCQRARKNTESLAILAQIWSDFGLLFLLP